MSAIGRLDTFVELIGVQRVDDGAGGWTRSDNVEASVWARVRPASANEQRNALRQELRISHIIVIRWNADLTPHFLKGSRARWTDRAGRLREVRVEAAYDPQERGRWIEMQAIEGGAL